MEIRQLKYFIAAAKCLNFTTAAEECFIVQSAMSQQIAALEKELGVSLFTRGNRSLSLTPEGRAFKVEAGKICINSMLLWDWCKTFHPVTTVRFASGATAIFFENLFQEFFSFFNRKIRMSKS